MHIEIDDDDLETFIRRYVEQRIESQIAVYLKHQLKDVITREIAKLRLTDPNAPILSEMIHSELREVVKQARNDELTKKFVGKPKHKDPTRAS